MKSEEDERDFFSSLPSGEFVKQRQSILGGTAMRNRVVVGLIAVVSIGLPALSSGKGDPAAGKVLYAKRCGTCHGPAGEPKEAVAKMMKVEIPHLGATEVQKKSDEDLKKAVTKGSGKMKGVQGLSDKDVANLIAYVRSLAQK